MLKKGASLLRALKGNIQDSTKNSEQWDRTSNKSNSFKILGISLEASFLEGTWISEKQELKN